MIRVTARCDAPHTCGPPSAGQVQLVAGAITRQEEARTSGTGGRLEAGSLETGRKLMRSRPKIDGTQTVPELTHKRSSVPSM
jgi:hypothetical protein